MLQNNRCIIVASGASIRSDFNIPIKDLPLWDIIKSECLFTLNWSFKWIEPTIAFYRDYQFYQTERDKNTSFDKLPMIITLDASQYHRKDGIKLSENVVTLKGSNSYYGEDSWKLGFFSGQLCSLFTLNFALRCGFQEIYLLGCDGNAINGHTHFYDDDPTVGTYMWVGEKKCGVGFNSRGYYRTGNYNNPKELNNYWYRPFESEKNKIINVSPESALTIFPKWNYEQFYQYLKDNPIQVNRDEVRNNIKQLINEKI